MTHQDAQAPARLTAEREQIHRNMLSAVAHDLKSPLSSIIGSLEIFTVMKDKLPPAKSDELIGVALQEARRLNSFITNVLDMARLESDALKPKQEKVDVGTLLQSLLTPSHQAAQQGTVSIQPSAPLTVTSDSALLTRVVELVVDNAIKYGGSTPHVEISYGMVDGQGFIAIIDNGDGVANNQREEIFGKYVRLARPGKKAVSGAGLGLPIAREIMRLLNGTISANGNPEGGTVVTLRFPA